MIQIIKMTDTLLLAPICFVSSVYTYLSTCQIISNNFNWARYLKTTSGFVVSPNIFLLRDLHLHMIVFFVLFSEYAHYSLLECAS